ncbi:MAG: Uma2 family endonuclease [Anaerolineae bacterium]|nr:Uma2 family endonuclease [Anaerolineae bacterium]
MTLLEAIQTGDVILNVSEQEYLDKYAEEHYEWIGEVAYKIPVVTLTHMNFVGYFSTLLQGYFLLNPIGLFVGFSFLLRMESVAGHPHREPDFAIVLNENMARLHDTFIQDRADMVIEIVSPESTERDYGKKFQEYEAAGITEYWIVDALRKECRFLRLNSEGRYQSQFADGDGNYRTPILPQLILHVPTLWQESLPNMIEVLADVRKMLGVED